MARPLVGDINFDGKINSSDLLCMKKYILGLIDYQSEDEFYVSDVNEDSKVNSIDYLLLKKFVLGIIPELTKG